MRLTILVIKKCKVILNIMKTINICHFLLIAYIVAQKTHFPIQCYYMNNGFKNRYNFPWYLPSDFIPFWEILMWIWEAITCLKYLFATIICTYKWCYLSCYKKYDFANMNVAKLATLTWDPIILLIGFL